MKFESTRGSRPRSSTIHTDSEVRALSGFSSSEFIKRILSTPPLASPITTGIIHASATSGETEVPSIVHKLAELPAGMYDSRIAYILACASAWAYSDIDNFSRMLAARGIDNNYCNSITFQNDALFIDASAYFAQSEDGRIGILCFRGTEPRNVVNWLTNVNSHPDPFNEMGPVHGGFYRSVRSLWPMIVNMINSALKAEKVCADINRDQKIISNIESNINDISSKIASIDKVGRSIEKKLNDMYPSAPSGDSTSPTDGSSGDTSNRKQRGPDITDGHINNLSAPKTACSDESASFKSNDLKELKALYITGHSLGGAMAIIAAAIIHSSSELEPIKKVLRGVYTFGAPMVGGRVFSETFNKAFGPYLFNHVYGHDVVPKMPPRTMGSFIPFGKQYVSTPYGWQLERRFVRQAILGGLSMGIGVMAFVRNQFPLLNWIPLHVSWADHSPLNYLRTSQIVYPGSEFG